MARTYFSNGLLDCFIVRYIRFLPMHCSQMWNTKLQTYKSKFVCWLERMVRGRGFWWSHLGLITVTVSDLLYMVFAQFESVLITVTLTRESKIMFNLKCKWCCMYCMFSVDVSPPFVQEHKCGELNLDVQAIARYLKSRASLGLSGKMM